MDIDTLNIKWSTKLPGSGHGITSVLGGVDVVYAAYNGWVFRLDQASGKKLHENGLPGTGSEEVRMDMDQKSNELFIGTNGRAIGLHPNNLETVYSTSLAESGNSTTWVTTGPHNPYFANNGHVFEVANDGKVKAHNPLRGLGTGDTRLAVDTHGTGLVFAGLNGLIIGLSLSGFPVSYGAWMGKISDQIGPKKLREVALLGTHDSGTYGISANSDVTSDDMRHTKYLDLVPSLGYSRNSILSAWGLSQPLNFFQQLTAGVRYIDLRVQALPDNRHAFVHGLVSVSVDELFKQVNTFLNDPENKKEVLLLDFNHFFEYNDSRHANLTALIESDFSSKLIPDTFKIDVTLNQLWSTPHRILVFRGEGDIANKHNFHLHPYRIDSPWVNRNDGRDVITALEHLLTEKHEKFFVLQGVITLNASVISNGLIPFSDNLASLLSLATTINGRLTASIREWRDGGVNIVIADYFNWDPGHIEAVVGLNLANVADPPAQAYPVQG